MSDSENALRLFLNGFAARDIADSLLSFDDTTRADAIRTAMDAQELDAVGIRKSGAIAGWLTRDDLGSESDQYSYSPFQPTTVIAEAASLNDVIQQLSAQPFLFVRSFGQVSGILRMCDLQKAPMRMWLFGLITITELRVTRMIDEVCPEGSWQRYLSEGRLNMARKMQDVRRRRNQPSNLLDCLQFADKGEIVARDQALRRYTRFKSRRSVQAFVDGLQDLRNNLAHALDISGNWDMIRDLASNVHRIVLGPPDLGDDDALLFENDGTEPKMNDLQHGAVTDPAHES